MGRNWTCAFLWRRHPLQGSAVLPSSWPAPPYTFLLGIQEVAELLDEVYQYSSIDQRGDVHSAGNGAQLFELVHCWCNFS